MTDSRTPEALLVADKITRRFGGLLANQDVCLTLARGQLHALLGPNGAGKSTCINMLSGDLPPSSGRILFQGRDISGLTAAERSLVGIKSNEHRMQSLGYVTFRYKLAAFALAGGLGGVAGFLYAVVFGFVTPELLSWHQSGNVLLMVILGGMGNLVGAVAGAFAFVAMQEVFSMWTKHWQLAMGLMIVAAVLFMPGGLSAVPGRIKRALQGGSAHD